MNSVTAGIPQNYKANFSAGASPPITPKAQAQFSSSDPSKIAITPVAGTFDVFRATFVGGNADGTPASVNVLAVLPPDAAYSGFSGSAPIQATPTVITLMTLTAVP